MRLPIAKQIGEVDDNIAQQKQQKQKREQQEHHPLDQHRSQSGKTRGKLQALVKQAERQPRVPHDKQPHEEGGSRDCDTASFRRRQFVCVDTANKRQ